MKLFFIDMTVMSKILLKGCAYPAIIKKRIQSIVNQSHENSPLAERSKSVNGGGIDIKHGAEPNDCFQVKLIDRACWTVYFISVLN
jgi:hypothetical protein